MEPVSYTHLDPVEVLYRRLFHSDGYGCVSVDIRGFILYVCLASGRFMGKLGRLEGEPVAKPVRRAYLGGYLVYDVGRRRAKSLLGIDVYKRQTQDAFLDA